LCDLNVYSALFAQTAQLFKTSNIAVLKDCCRCFGIY